ncbi:MAG: hypothetical protein JWN99_1249 [Ilumatobacteraceae bacterium]|nr:hypothetical protein [Ilumatobacteraceae bacterium]
MSTLTLRAAAEAAHAELHTARDLYGVGRISLDTLNEKSASLTAAVAAFKASTTHLESDIQRALRTGAITADMLGGAGKSGTGLAGSVAASGFNLKSNPSVVMSGVDVFAKANVFPASTVLSPVGSNGIAVFGQDTRFLWPNLPSVDAGNDTAVSDFVQSARSLTGTVQRAIDATTTKANVDTTIAATVEAIAQFAVTINSVPNIVLQSVPQMTAFLSGEGQFQVSKALDDHVLAQIVAATPAFGKTGTTTIDKVRNAIAAMRALGANPNVLVVNPTDAAALDLFRVGGSTTTDGPYAFDTSSAPSHPLWGLKIVERIGGGSDPMYLLDTAMLGVLYVGQVRFDADPYSGFKSNTTTLRVETNALMHVRNVQGARRIAAS